MTLPTAEEVTNLYLYGSSSKPANLLDPSLLQPRTQPAAVPVDLNEYMTTGAGRFVDAADFKFLNDLFNSSSLPAGTYTKDDIFKKFGYRDPVTGKNLKDASVAFNQIYYDSSSADRSTGRPTQVVGSFFVFCRIAAQIRGGVVPRREVSIARFFGHEHVDVRILIAQPSCSAISKLGTFPTCE